MTHTYGYYTCALKYTDGPHNGAYRFAYMPKNARFWPTLTDARADAYRKLSHNGDINRNLDYMCIIIHRTRNQELLLAGEVMNTAYEDIFWYPSNDGVYANGGKYTLYKNGTLGTKWR